MADIEIKKRSVTRNDAGSVYGSGAWHWILNPQYTQAPGDLPAYWSPARDVVLRDTLWQPFHDFWTGAVSIAITKMASQGWDVEGDTPRLRNQAQDLLLSADNNQSWVSFLSRHLQDFICTDNGAFIEIVRATSGAGSRIVGLMHLDSQRCTRTGDPSIPILYTDSLGKVHEVKDYQVMTFADMTSPSETYNGVGLSAASRAWGAIKKLEVIERFIYEKIAGVRPKALDLVGGVSEQQIRTGIDSVEEDNHARGYVQYMGAAIIPTLSDIAITHTRINLAELPDGFDYKLQFDNAALVIANAIGLDVQDLQPLSGQRLGTAMQSEVLDSKARGKGQAAWRQQITHAFNQFVVASTVMFGFSEKDNREKLENANITKTYSDSMGTLVEKGILTSDQAKQILADADIIPDEFVPEDTTPRESLSDDEKPEVEADAQAATNEQEQVAQAVETTMRTKAVETVITQYSDQLRAVMNRTLAGKSDATEMARIHRTLIRQLGREAYVEGLKEGGVDEDEIDEQDIAAIAEWTANQLSSIRGFADDTVKAFKEADKRTGILTRFDEWVAAMRALGSRGYASAQKNATGTWRLGKTEQHCSTCARLNNKSHRLSWYLKNNYIPREPGSETLECGGWECDCRIVDKRGRQLLPA